MEKQFITVTSDDVTAALKLIAEKNKPTKPTEREIVSMLAGGLMTACVQVREALSFEVSLRCRFQCETDQVIVSFSDQNGSEWLERVWLGADDAVEKLHCLIMKVRALGEVS